MKYRFSVSQTNLLFFNPETQPESSVGKYLKLGPYYFATEVEKGTRKIGKDQIGLSGVQREFLQVQENSEVGLFFEFKF